MIWYAMAYMFGITTGIFICICINKYQDDKEAREVMERRHAQEREALRDKDNEAFADYLRRMIRDTETKT